MTSLRCVGCCTTVLTIAMTLFCAAHTTALGQVVRHVYSRHFIGPSGFSNTPLASNGKTIVAGSQFKGPLRSDDYGRSFSMTMDPEQRVRIEGGGDIAWVVDSTFIVSGSPYGSHAGGRTFASYDAGRTWTEVIAYGHDGVFGSGDGSVRWGSYYSVDSARSFVHIPEPDSFPPQTRQRHFYLKNGRFVIFESAQKKWFEIDIANQRYAPSDIPDSVSSVYRLADGRLLGHRHQGTRSIFCIQAVRGEPFVDTVFTDESGEPLDSTWFGNVDFVDGGAVLASFNKPGTTNNTHLLIITADGHRVVRAADIDEDGVTWSRPFASHDGKCIIPINNEFGRNRLHLLDTETGNARFIRTRGFESEDGFSYFKPTLMLDSLALDWNSFGRLAALDLMSEHMTMGPSLQDTLDRPGTIAVDKITFLDTTAVALDELGDLAEIVDSGRAHYFAPNLTHIDRVFIDDTLRSIRLGNGLVWSDSNNTLLVGGTTLSRIDSDARFTTVINDTTSFWTRLSDGSELTGHVRIMKKRPEDTSYQHISTPGDGSTGISTILEAADGSLLAGLRGYRQIVDTNEPDIKQGGIWRSTDGGFNWNKIDLPIEGDMVLSIERNPRDGSLWASVTRVLREIATEVDTAGVRKVSLSWATMIDMHLLKSLDNGASWQVVRSVQSNTPWLTTVGNATFFGNAIAWATPGNVFLSVGDGTSWSAVEGFPSLSTIISHVVFDQTGQLWISTSDGVFSLPPSAVSVSEADDNNDLLPETNAKYDDQTFLLKVVPNPSEGYFHILASINPNMSVDQNDRRRVINTDDPWKAVQEMTIVDIKGRIVCDLLPSVRMQDQQGTIHIPVDLRSESAGQYFVIIHTAAGIHSQPLTVLK